MALSLFPVLSSSGKLPMNHHHNFFHSYRAGYSAHFSGQRLLFPLNSRDFRISSIRSLAFLPSSLSLCFSSLLSSSLTPPFVLLFSYVRFPNSSVCASPPHVPLALFQASFFVCLPLGFFLPFALKRSFSACISSASYARFFSIRSRFFFALSSCYKYVSMSCVECETKY